MTLPYAINLYNSVKRGNGFIANITDQALNWRRTIRRVGGFWQASFDYSGKRDELDDLFFDGLMKEVREYSGGVQAWQGFIGDMSYKRGPVTWQRSIFDVYNAQKILYTRQFQNLFTNGSVESGAWTAWGTATVTQSTFWASDQTYSCKIVATFAGLMGAIIQTGIPIVAGTEYNLTITFNVILGRWRVLIHPDGLMGTEIAAKSDITLGVTTLSLKIPSTSTFTGNVTVRIINSAGDGVAADGTLYADGAVFTEVNSASDTGWITDADSITEFGRFEKISLEGVMNQAAAIAKIATALKREAWPRLLAPGEFGGTVDDTDSLAVSCYGYIYTLPWTINTVTTEQTASATVTALAANRDYVASSQVDTNAMLFTPDNLHPISVWQVLKTLVNSGDAAGNLWALGMYSDRALVYNQFSSAIAYRYRDDKLYNPAGGEMEAWLTLPGWASLDDAPLVPYQTLTGADDPRRIIVEEVEFTAPDVLRFRSKVID